MKNKFTQNKSCDRNDLFHSSDRNKSFKYKKIIDSSNSYEKLFEITNNGLTMSDQKNRHEKVHLITIKPKRSLKNVSILNKIDNSSLNNNLRNFDKLFQKKDLNNFEQNLLFYIMRENFLNWTFYACSFLKRTEKNLIDFLQSTLINLKFKKFIIILKCIISENQIKIQCKKLY